MSLTSELIAVGPYHPNLLTILNQFGFAEPYDGTLIGTPVGATLFPLEISSRARELMEILGAESGCPASFHIHRSLIQWDHLHSFAEETGHRDHVHVLRTLLHEGFTILLRIQ